MEAEKMKTRKAHRKSRNGCLPCKARHVKCDETRPACVNCSKYGSECEYPQPKRRITSTASPCQPISTSSSTDGSALNQLPHSVPGSPHSPLLNVAHLRLLHHFTTVTGRTLAHEPEAEDVYHTYLVKVGFEFPFLLQGILALAALHLSRLDQSLRSEYLHQAESHHDAALTYFRDVNDIDEANFPAVLGFATLLFSYSCALPLGFQNGPEQTLDSILQNFALTRQVRPMVSERYYSVLESEISRAIPRDTRNIKFEEPPAETELIKLRKFSEVTRHLYPPDINEAYSNAIHALENLFAVAKGSPRPPSDSLIKIFLYRVSPRFMDLLSERQPGALIIFAHYAALVARGRHYWFFEGVAEQILHVAEALVPSEWKSWLEWPREQVGTGRISQDAMAISPDEPTETGTRT